MHREKIQIERLVGWGCAHSSIADEVRIGVSAPLFLLNESALESVDMLRLRTVCLMLVDGYDKNKFNARYWRWTVLPPYLSICTCGNAFHFMQIPYLIRNQYTTPLDTGLFITTFCSLHGTKEFYSTTSNYESICSLKPLFVLPATLLWSVFGVFL